MTNPEITQADRDAAYRYRLYTSSLSENDYRAKEWRESINSGKRDNSELVQAFARHRAQSVEALRAEVERLQAECVAAKNAMVRLSAFINEIHILKSCEAGPLINSKRWRDLGAALTQTSYSGSAGSPNDQRLEAAVETETEGHGILDAAMADGDGSAGSTPAPGASEALAEIQKFVENFLSPWGAWKTEWWEAQMGEAAFTQANALKHVHNIAALAQDQRND